MQADLPDRIVSRARRIVHRIGRAYRHEPRPLPTQDPGHAVMVPFTQPPPSGGYLSRRAVVAHLFHPDVTAEFFSYFMNIPGDVDLFASTDTITKKEFIEAELGRWSKGAVEVRIVPNIGRDMAPKFVTFADIYHRYDVCLFVHSKKSDYLGSGVDWRRAMMSTLCGSTEIVESILALLAPAMGVGLVFPDHFPGILELLEWGGNRALCGRLAKRAGIPLSRARALEFVSGSMFWARPEALRPLLSLSLTYADFPNEAGQRDGTIAHALERLLLFSTEKAGLDWIKIADASHHQGPAEAVSVSDLSELPSAIQAVRRPLLRSGATSGSSARS